MNHLSFFLLLLLPCLGIAQPNQKYFNKFIGFNYASIDTSNSDIRAVVKLWNKYLIKKIYGYQYKIDTSGYYYWNDEEKQFYNEPDLILATDPYLATSQTNILSIKPIENNFFKITSVKGFVDDSTTMFKTQVIFSVLAKKVNNSFKLFNYFYLDKNKLIQKTIGNVCYYYPSAYKFNEEKAKNFVSFEDSLSVLFSLPEPKSITYIVDNNNDALLDDLGYYYDGFRGSGEHAGKYIYKNNIILSSVDENHRHEMVHYFTNLKNPEVIRFFDEGLATYFGGSMGHSLNWHLEYINEYIKDNPALDITDASKFGYLNAKTNPQYAFGAIIIKYAIDKLGFQKVLDLLQYSDKKISYKEVIEKELGINKSELNTFLKTYITEHLTVKQ